MKYLETDYINDHSDNNLLYHLNIGLVCFVDPTVKKLNIFVDGWETWIEELSSAALKRGLKYWFFLSLCISE